MKARFSSMVPNASSVAARRMYGDFGAPLPLVVVVVSDIDSLTRHLSVICRKISGVGWIGRGGRTAGEQPESEAVQVTLLHGFRSGHLQGSDGVVAGVLVGVEIYEPAGALRTRWILLHHFNADGGARQLVPMIVDVLPGLIVHLEGAHFGSSPCGRIAHFDGAGAGGKFATAARNHANQFAHWPASLRPGECDRSMAAVPRRVGPHRHGAPGTAMARCPCRDSSGSPRHRDRPRRAPAGRPLLSRDESCTGRRLQVE